MAFEKEFKAVFTADTEQLKKGTAEAAEKGKSFGEKMIGIAKAIGAAWLFKEAVQGLKNLVGGMMEAADRIQDLSQITGMTTDAIQEYQYVARIAGVETEALTSAAEGLTQRLARGGIEAGPLNRGLEKLGINAKTATGQLRSGADIMEEAIGKLAEMDNITERNVIGAQLFAGAWKDLAPILGLGKDAIKTLRIEAHELGAVMSEETLNAIDNLRIAKEKLKTTAQSLSRELGMVFVPVLNKIVTALNDWLHTERKIFKDERLSWWEKLVMAPDDYKKFLAQQAEIRKQYREQFKNLSDVELEIRRGKMATKEANEQIELEIKERAEHKKFIESEIAALKELNKGAVEPAQKTVADYREEIKKLEDELETLTLADGKRAEQIKKQIDEYQKLIDKIVNYKTEIKTVVAPIEEISAKIPDLKLAPEIDTSKLVPMKQALVEITENYSKAEMAAMSFADMVMQGAIQQADSLKDLLRITIETARKIIATYLAESVAAAVKGALKSVPFPFNIIAAGIAGASAATLFNSLVPKFAEGGAVTGPTLALIGEAPGISRANPEYVGTAKQLSQMGVMGGERQLVARISRGDLLFILNEGKNYSKNNY